MLLGALSIAVHATLAAAAGGTALSPPPPSPSHLSDYRIEATPDDLMDRLDEEELQLLELLNRVDRERMPGLDSLVVPERFGEDALDHSPFPARLGALDGRPKALLVHQPLQVWAAYEAGELVRWGPVSSGRAEHPTPVGRFFLTWRSEGRRSTVNPEWFLEWYFNFHNERGISFHQYALPGYPASHACVRLLERDARWIYGWGEGWVLDERGWEVLEEGTAVWILGAYDFDAPPPWLDREHPHPPIPRKEIEEEIRGG
jgi:hypothetical protein